MALLAALALGAAAAGVEGPGARAVADPGGSPDVVVIMTDDLDVIALGTALNLGLMPNLKRYLIDRGAAFTNAFVTNSVCCPSRATFLTGQYAHNHGVRTNATPGGGVTALDDRSTLATWLRGAGYRTGMIGKYLNGYGRFDVNRDGTVDLGDLIYIPPGWDDWQALLEPSVTWMYNYALNDNGTLLIYGSQPEDYQTDVLAARAARFIQAAAELPGAPPFFLLLMPSAPHVENPPDLIVTQYSEAWQGSIRPAARHVGTVSATPPPRPSFNEADVSDKPPWLQTGRPLLTPADMAHVRNGYQARIAALRAVDDLVGTVGATLQQAGRLNGTLLIFTSDNGYHWGEHRLSVKETAYDESIRVPLLVAAPGFPPQTIRAVVLNNDLAPTILDFAGVAAGLFVDGTSLRPLLQDPNVPWRQRLLVEHWDVADSNLCQGYPEPCALFAIPSYTAVRTAPTARYVPGQLYVEYADAAESREFYDMATDPYQLASLHLDQSPTRVFQGSVHAQWLGALRSCGAGTCQTYEFRK